jgi:hypothetical protein
METENESAAMDLQVARERTVVALNISNPIAASQSAVVDQTYHNPVADADADVDVSDGDADPGPFAEAAVRA